MGVVVVIDEPYFDGQNIIATNGGAVVALTIDVVDAGDTIGAVPKAVLEAMLAEANGCDVSVRVPKGSATALCYECGVEHFRVVGERPKWDRLPPKVDALKGRGRRVVRRGEDHHNAKLKSADVELIRSSAQSGAAIARALGVSKTVVSLIRRGLAWTVR